ncbi:zeta toxin family protein [Streptomyces cucumeris]|uniref:zeta toxin family protein n=1 Tax=Streptomyces cucumeris TaxID=2962890 RepID=UPI003D709C50
MRETDGGTVRLRGDEHWSEEVLADTVLPGALEGAVPQARPVVVYVLGQPGSGKTTVIDLVHAALAARGGAVRVDRDTYKTLHPHYDQYLAEDVRTAGERVRPETYQWQAAVEAAAREGRYDAVVEVPLSRPEDFLAAALASRKAGYWVEVVALAVSLAVSELSALERFLRLAQEGQAPRYVSWDNQSACADALAPTLGAVEAAHLAHRMFVLRRGETALDVIYDNALGPSGRLVRPADASDAVLTEWRRPWGARETGRIRRQLVDADRRLADPALPEDWTLAVRRNSERAAALAEPVRRIAQPRREAPGVDYHRLSVDEHKWIYEELILPSLGPITGQDQPVVVYVMGQPGAGKTRLAQMILRSLRRPVRITGEVFKQAHPDYLQLLREEPRTASARIRADYRAWQAWAEAHVRRQRGDMVIEITPESAAQFAARAAVDRKAGYRVQLAVLAVREADSRQGTAARYAHLDRRGIPARFTTAAGHNACFDVVPETVALVEQMAAVDEVVVMRRDAHPLYCNHLTPQQRWARRPAADLAVTAEHYRPYTPEEAGAFWSTQRWLHTAMPQYRDDLVAIAGLACPLMPAQRPHQLAMPAPAAALPVPA